MSPLADMAVPSGNELTRATKEFTIAVAVTEPKLRLEVLNALSRLAVPISEDYGDSEPIASVERSRPGVVILGLPGLSEPARILAGIAGLNPAPLIVAVNDCAEPEVILKAMRAGAAEFVYLPLDSFAFAEAMMRAIAACGSATRRERSAGLAAGFVSAKGGCGSTTLACHAASHIRRTTKKEVLLADLDPASGIAGSIMHTDRRYTLGDAVQNLHRMDLKLWKGLVATSPSGVDVMPAPLGTSAPVLPISRSLPQMVRFWRTHYDFMFLDLGHGTTPGLMEALDSLDTLVLVATNEVPALRQAKEMLQLLAERDFGAKRVKLVINRMPKRMQIQLPELERVMGHPIYSAIPNDYERLNEAYAESRLLEPGSDLALQIGKFAAMLSGIAEPDKAPRGFFGLRGRK